MLRGQPVLAPVFVDPCGAFDDPPVRPPMRRLPPAGNSFTPTKGAALTTPPASARIRDLLSGAPAGVVLQEPDEVGQAAAPRSYLFKAWGQRPAHHPQVTALRGTRRASRRRRTADLPATAQGVDPGLRPPPGPARSTPRWAGGYTAVAPYHRRYGYYSKYSSKPGGAAHAAVHSFPGGSPPRPSTVYTKSAQV
eukprot:TRINITY_DN16787_c0_g1_i1.p2 TRINITY_DN16787_c0_g1~~TRINITY_DN16787_c0_g1_i1.p2  ORF type:complete len:210 (+),score=42.26 TRINITY_DN16787_c0_g1_i1:49-630(+)